MGFLVGMSGAGSGSITADETGLIQWSASGVPMARVYVNGTLMAEALSGKTTVSWITPGNLYHFYLIPVDQGVEGLILASVDLDLREKANTPATGTGTPATGTPATPGIFDSITTALASLPGGWMPWAIGAGFLLLRGKKS